MTTRDAVRQQNSSDANEPLIHRQAPAMADNELSVQEMAEVEWMLRLMTDAEGAMGCDYPEGPMSPPGCVW